MAIRVDTRDTVYTAALRVHDGIWGRREVVGITKQGKYFYHSYSPVKREELEEFVADLQALLRLT